VADPMRLIRSEGDAEPSEEVYSSAEYRLA
jgi:hypothetical protein